MAGYLSSLISKKGRKNRRGNANRPDRTPIIEFHIVSYGLNGFCKRFLHLQTNTTRKVSLGWNGSIGKSGGVKKQSKVIKDISKGTSGVKEEIIVDKKLSKLVSRLDSSFKACHTAPQGSTLLRGNFHPDDRTLRPAGP
jgi:hypothetical protein